MSTLSTGIAHPGSDNHVDAAAGVRSVEQRTQPGVGETIKRVVIAFAGLLGVIAVLVTIAPFFGWTVVRLATGSMAPSFPTDSLLITHSVPASEASVGDVVMVQRTGALPITHRVIATKQLGGGLTKLRLKGDDNRTPDVAPYLVRSVGLVTAGVPFGGSLVAELRSTAGLAGLTVFATLIVLWAWWPQSRRNPNGPADLSHPHPHPHSHTEGL
jgi:signal peptidase